MFWGNSSFQDAVDQVKVRDPSTFNWTSIFFLMVVILVYAYAYSKKNFKLIQAGLALYVVHWNCEIWNAIIYKVFGAPLWAVSNASSSYVLMIGVSVELNLMFALAGMVAWLTLPADRNKKILGIPVKILVAIGTALLCGILEIFLTSTPAFNWVYPWWGFLPVFVLVYIPFFLAAVYVPDWKPKFSWGFIISLAALNLILFVTLASLGII